MRVSVVIPTYNSGPLVTEAVECVLAQTRPPFEVLIIDDGSTDDTRARLEHYGPPVRFVWQPNGGVSSARNRGLAEVTGDLIAFLDADDVWHPDKLRRQLEAFRTRPELGLLGTGTVRWPGSFPPHLDASPAAVRDVPLEALVVRNHFVTSSIVLRREVARDVGQFDLSLSGPEDYDFWLRVGRRAPVANLDLPLTGYRDLGGSLSKQAPRMEAGMRRIFDKLEEQGAFAGRPWLRRKAWSYFLYDWARMYRDAGEFRPAVTRFVGALLQYPLPFNDPGAPKPVRRARQLVGTLWDWVSGRRPDWVVSAPTISTGTTNCPPVASAGVGRR
jgi:glycosyltransferase involved in cell wall biosynthesis